MLMKRLTLCTAVDRGEEIWSDEYSEEDVVMHYADLFPGYPEHLTMARDLANFVRVVASCDES